jgi:hypothetical protein
LVYHHAHTQARRLKEEQDKIDNILWMESMRRNRVCARRNIFQAAAKVRLQLRLRLRLQW